MSLSRIRDDGYRTLYFHAMSGITEFSVSTNVLQDKTLKKGENYYNFHIVGNKGPLTQGPSSIIDSKTCIDYFTQINRNGIACWDTTVKLSPETFSEYNAEKYLLALSVYCLYLLCCCLHSRHLLLFVHYYHCFVFSILLLKQDDKIYRV